MSKLARVAIGSWLGVLLASLASAPPARAADVSVQLGAGDGFVVRDSSGFVERLRVDEATGNVSRNGALFVHTTGGTTNLFMGQLAGNPGITGAYNVGMGFGALYYATSSYGNTGVGSLALVRPTGSGNSGFGFRALTNNTAGYWNTAAGSTALYLNQTGHQNSAFGRAALAGNITGGANAAFGSYALRSNTSGSENAAFGQTALRFNATGARNSAFGRGALYANIAGNDNAAFGHSALQSNDAGNENTAFGTRALQSNTSGLRNVAVGFRALELATGGFNTSVGHTSLSSNTTGTENSALGHQALRDNTTGIFNVAIGAGALRNMNTGSRNVALGHAAGLGLTSGDNNIYITAGGTPNESGQIRIGSAAQHTQAHIAGIWNATSSGGVAALVNSGGTLGTLTSSARFKQDVHDMGAESDLVMKLRPVSFRYREDAVGADESRVPQYGLIAEEVAEVAPELVAPDAEGKPYSVKYHVLPALMLNELQQQERTIAAQAQQLSEQRAVIAALAARVETLEAR